MIRHADIPFVLGHVVISLGLWILARIYVPHDPYVLALGATTLSAFVLMFIDKVAARAQAWRVPERAFFFVGFLGGSLGILAGMKAFRHKTSKQSFQLGLGLVFLMQFALIAWYLLRTD